MEVIRLEFQPQIKDKILEFLNSFFFEVLKKSNKANFHK